MRGRWETYADIQAASAVAGLPVSSHQLRRWRGMGLLPEVRQVGRGRPSGGSDTRYPAGTAAQAIEIGRMLAEKEKLAGLGWKLWLKGYPVREDHWRLPLDRAHKALVECRDTVRVAVARDERERRHIASTIYDGADIDVVAGTPIHAALRRLPQHLRSVAARVAAEILLGRFKVDAKTGELSDSEAAEAIKAIAGVSADLPSIQGVQLSFGGLASVIAGVSSSLSRLTRKTYSIEETPLEDRRRFLDAQAIALDLYHATAWVLKGGLNLRMAERIISKSDDDIQAMMLLIFSKYSEDHHSEHSSVITEMAAKAAGLRSMAVDLEAQLKSLPSEHPFWNPAKLRRAIINPALLRKIIASL